MSEEEEKDWITLRVYKSQVEAEVVYGLLKVNGVPCRMQGKDRVRPELSFATGIYIQIPEEYKETAEALLPAD